MLNRRFLREKILQNLYAFYQSGADDLLKAEKNIPLASQRLYELYLYLASAIVELADFAQERIDEGKQKHLPTAAEKNPNMRFVQNRVIEQLRTSPTRLLKCAEYKVSWQKQDEIFRHLYNAMLKYPTYQTYMDSPESSYEEDKTFLCGLFKRKIATDSGLYNFFEPNSLVWASDFNSVAFWLLKSLRNAEEGADIVIDFENFVLKDDLDFQKKLFTETVIHSEEYTPIIEQYLANWELERTPFIDVLLIKMAIVEMVYFPSIPVKVTLNEYIEIVKLYSTENSRIFVNGLLNKLSEDFIRNGKIKKSGRGLITG